MSKKNYAILAIVVVFIIAAGAVYIFSPGTSVKDLTVVYPYDGTMFPPEIAAPRMWWEDSTPGVKEWDILQHKSFFGQEKKPLPYLIGTMNMILHRILVPNLRRTNTLMEDIHNMPEGQRVDVILTNPPFGGRENKSVQENFPIKMQATEGLALQYVMRRLKNGKKTISFDNHGRMGNKQKRIRKRNSTSKHTKL